MNATPHSHKLEVDTRSIIYTYVRYGDQSKAVDPDPPFYGFRLRRAMRRIVKRHDRQSLKAGRREQTVQEATTQAVEFDPNQWGSKQRRKVSQYDGPGGES